jgi:regulator of G-protein signaling
MKAFHCGHRHLLCLTYNFIFQINIDSTTREAIIKSIREPTQTCFEEAQKIVYMHMEMDSYPRFLKSEMYQQLLKTVQSQSS